MVVVFGDDVVNIALSAIVSDLRTNPLTIRSGDVDDIKKNDAVYNKVFPYAGTPFNGRNYVHNPVSAVSPLIDISARGQVGTGSGVLIGGFIIQGKTSQTVLIRGTRPSLSTYGVSSALADPVLNLYSNTTLIGTNDNWKDSQQAAIQATGLAPANDAESAILVTLAPGLYTTILSGKSSATGVGLLETYLVGP
ncbi:MAG TPA: hypothetical protein VKC60_09220 [Opitutaceae bacterium]|nr:hypothetical protein [Opitutaceae bacterium]